MTAVYEHEGIRFLYPENWQLDDQTQDSQGLFCAVSLETPSGAIWTLNVESGLRDCDELASHVLQTMRDEYPELESEPHQGRLRDIATVGYEMHFYCLDMVVKAVVECFRWEDRTVMIMSQAEIDDYEILAPVFAAVAVSLLG